MSKRERQTDAVVPFAICLCILTQVGVSWNGVEIGKSAQTHATATTTVKCKQKNISVSSTK